MRTHILSLLAITILATTLSACTPTVTTRGNLISDRKIAEIKPDYATKYDVQDRWGPPTAVAPFEKNIWYYIGVTKEKMGIFKEEVVEQRTIAVKFNEYDTVVDIKEISPEEQQDIAFVERKTPTAGKEFTFIQQLIGNVGRFNSLPGEQGQ